MKHLLSGLLLFVFLTSCSTLSKYGVRGVKEKKELLTARWSKNLDTSQDTGNLPIALQSPLIYRGIVFVGDNNGTMMSYSLEDGRQVWSKKESAPYHSQPVGYKENIIYGNAAGRVFSRHYLSGKLNYAVDLDAAVESEPVVFKGRLFVHTRNHKIFALDVETGKILWAYKRSVPYITTLQRVSKPLVYNNRLYAGFADGSLAAFSLEEGVLLWETRVVEGTKFVDVDSSPIIFSGKLVATSLSDSLVVVNPRSGLIERKVPYAASRAPFYENNQLLLGTADGQLVRLDKNFKVLQTSKIAKDSISNIIRWKGRLVVSTVDGHLLVVNDKTLKAEEDHFLGHKSSAIFGYLSSTSEGLAALSSRNRLYVF